MFLKVVQARSFTDVAAQIGISPSAVAQSIARLEDIYGGELFIRNRRAPLELTPMGKEILQGARTIIDVVDRQMARATDVATSRTGTLSIGFSPGLASGPLREGIADFIAECPDVMLRLVEGVPETLYRNLNDRTIDVIIAAFLPPTQTPTIMREFLWHESLLAVLPANHPALVKECIGWADIIASPILLPGCRSEPTGYHPILQQMGGQRLRCQEHDVSPATLLELVALTLGVTIMFESACIDRPGVIHRPIVDEQSNAEIEAVWLSRDGNSARHRLVRHIRERARRRGLSYCI
jgi:LysR family hydrogen peroxide-inducible transcriptional activator